MVQDNKVPTPGWIKLIDAFGLAKGGLVVWLLGVAALSLNLEFYVLAFLSLAGAALLVGYVLWWLPSRRTEGQGEGGGKH